MARSLRIEYPGALYHVTSRVNEHQAIYYDEKDRLWFLESLKESIECYRVVIHAYTLLDNHFHLIIETPRGNLSKSLQTINTAYTVYFNRQHNRIGHLYQGRYKAILVDKDSYLLQPSRYIHLNPVRANTGLTNKEMGEYFGKISESAITETVRRVERRGEGYTLFKKEMEEIKKILINELCGFDPNFYNVPWQYPSSKTYNCSPVNRLCICSLHFSFHGGIYHLQSTFQV